MFFSCLALLTTAFAATITVQVGAGGQRIYEPEAVTAQLGDVVNFQFAGGNHTATQSTFANPCVNQGFKSGFRPASATNTSTFAIMINSTEPIWVYCAQMGHCQAGMVMSINAPASGDRTHAAFKALAQDQNAGDAYGSGPSRASVQPSPTNPTPNDAANSGAAASSGAASYGHAQARTVWSLVAAAVGILL